MQLGAGPHNLATGRSGGLPQFGATPMDKLRQFAQTAIRPKPFHEARQRKLRKLHRAADASMS